MNIQGLGKHYALNAKKKNKSHDCICFTFIYAFNVSVMKHRKCILKKMLYVISVLILLHHSVRICKLNAL